MISSQHPTILKLRDEGFKVALHLYFNQRGESALASAHNPDTKETINGTDKSGNIEAALEQLGRRVGVIDDRR